MRKGAAARMLLCWCDRPVGWTMEGRDALKAGRALADRERAWIKRKQ